MKKFIAERRLLYSLKGSGIRKEFSIGITDIYIVDKDTAHYPAHEGYAACQVEIEGLDEKCPVVYGADTLQAINLASNAEPFLKRLQKKYDLYWLSGEPYFDGANEV
jgi:hypothetical protein